MLLTFLWKEGSQVLVKFLHVRDRHDNMLLLFLQNTFAYLQTDERATEEALVPTATGKPVSLRLNSGKQQQPPPDRRTAKQAHVPRPPVPAAQEMHAEGPPPEPQEH